MPRNSRAMRRIVVSADEYLRVHMDRPIYTEELCDVLAVSASSLADAFRAVFMISPHRFLKLRRMSYGAGGVAVTRRAGAAGQVGCPWAWLLAPGPVRA